MRTGHFITVAVAGAISAASIFTPRPAVPAEPGAPPKELVNRIGMTLRLIPAGEFLMGISQQELQRLNERDKYDRYRPRYPGLVVCDDEVPAHRVRITRPFYLGVYEVTVGQFRRFVEDSHYKTDAEKDGKGGLGWNVAAGKYVRHAQYTWRSPGFPQADEHPVVNVSWNDAVAFCQWLSRKERQTYRLPTEAEWEYACRAGTTTRYYCGDDPEQLATVGNVADATAKETLKKDYQSYIESRDGYAFTAPVGRFQPNRFGLYDMLGNVWEWCADGYDAQYYARSPADDPRGPSQATERVARGGAWSVMPRGCRAATRHRSTPAACASTQGVRIACEPAP
jgi:formylglycine-generating enzyme required for sulfatase activity